MRMSFKQLAFIVDCLLFAAIGITLAEVHYLLSCAALLIAIPFSAIKFYDYIKKRKNENKN